MHFDSMGRSPVVGGMVWRGLHGYTPLSDGTDPFLASQLIYSDLDNQFRPSLGLVFQDYISLSRRPARQDNPSNTTGDRAEQTTSNERCKYTVFRPLSGDTGPRAFMK